MLEHHPLVPRRAFSRRSLDCMPVLTAVRGDSSCSAPRRSNLCVVLSSLSLHTPPRTASRAVFRIRQLTCPSLLQTLEELDEVFSMSTSRQVAYGLASPAYWFRRYILRQKVHRVPLHEYHPSEEKDRPTVEHREKV